MDRYFSLGNLRSVWSMRPVTFFNKFQFWENAFQHQIMLQWEKRVFTFLNLSFNWESQQFRHGLVVRIAGSHPAGPGSIPGAGTYLFFFLTAILIIRTNQKTLNNHQIQEWGNLISFEVLRHFTFGRENFPSFRDLKMLDYSRVIHPFTVENEM